MTRVEKYGRLSGMKLQQGDLLLIDTESGILSRSGKTIGTVTNFDSESRLFTYKPFGFWKRLWLQIKYQWTGKQGLR